MNRLDRRIALLRGKRNGCFDTDQYYLERAARARVARRVRVHLRRGQPLMLLAPRWSQAHRFLDDVAVDLAIGEPATAARPLSLAPLSGRTTHQAWAWLVQALAEFGDLHSPSAAWQAVSSLGFRNVMAEHMQRLEDGRPRCLMLHGLEHAPLEAVNDLVHVFEQHRARNGSRRCFNLLLCGSVDSSLIDFDATEKILLTDFAREEALGALIELLGPDEPALLQEAIDLIGGVPALLDAVGQESRSVVREIIQNRDAIWRLLGKLASEIRGAIEIVTGDDTCAGRLELLVRDGPQHDTADADPTLIRAGLALRDPRTDALRVRAPIFSDLALVG